MASRDFRALVEQNGVQTKQVIRMANFDGDAVRAKEVYEDLETRAGSGKRIVGEMVPIGDSSPFTNTVEGLTTRPVIPTGTPEPGVVTRTKPAPTQ